MTLMAKYKLTFAEVFHHWGAARLFCILRYFKNYSFFIKKMGLRSRVSQKTKSPNFGTQLTPLVFIG